MAAEPPRAPPLGGAGSVRVRTTATAVLVVGVALIAGAALLVAMLRGSLTDQVRTAASLRAQDVVSVLESGTPPPALAVNDDDDLAIQVIDRHGSVVAASPNLDGEPPIADLRPGQSAQVRNLPIGDDDDAFLIVAVAARGPEERYIVLVGRTTETVRESTEVVIGALAAGLPLLLLIVAATTWHIVGRALAPVDAIRTEVDEISTAQLHRRVPTPPVHDEIGRLAATMNRMLDRLEQGQARQRRFVSDASHELRSPVASIRQHTEVALAHPDNTTIPDLATTVFAETLRVQHLVTDLLLLARADEQTFALQRGSVDVDDIVFEQAARLRATTPVRINTTAVSAGRVSGDPAQLQRLVANLADNAARHATAQVAFTLVADDEAVVLRVEDDGDGIPEADRQRVFERFVRLDEARDRDHGGAGLGLPIVASIAAAHEGTVTVSRSHLGGARFEVRLPIRRE